MAAECGITCFASVSHHQSLLKCCRRCGGCSSIVIRSGPSEAFLEGQFCAVGLPCSGLSLRNKNSCPQETGGLGYGYIHVDWSQPGAHLCFRHTVGLDLATGDGAGGKCLNRRPLLFCLCLFFLSQSSGLKCVLA